MCLVEGVYPRRSARCIGIRNSPECMHCVYFWGLAMASLQIRNLPEDVYEALALRAERASRSLAQQALVELKGGDSAPSDKRRRVLESIRRDLAEGAVRLKPSPESLVRADRER